MNINYKRIATFAMSLLLAGCAGMSRGCSNFDAENFGADWIVVQYDYNLNPKNCWRLPNTSIANESQSDGIHWKDSNTGHMVHISGWYDRVQVSGGDWNKAASLLGVDMKFCDDGRYNA